jgi:hypothetical protein
VGGADGDVAQPAEVAERDLAERVDLVATDAVVGTRRLQSGLGLDECIEDGEGVCLWSAPCGRLLLQ